MSEAREDTVITTKVPSLESIAQPLTATQEESMTAPTVVVGIKETGNSRAALLTADDEQLAAEWALGDVARTVGAQLLVMAGGGTASVLPGTTSQYVLRKAPCPILIVPDPETA